MGRLKKAGFRSLVTAAGSELAWGKQAESWQLPCRFGTSWLEEVGKPSRGHSARGLVAVSRLPRINMILHVSSLS